MQWDDIIGHAQIISNLRIMLKTEHLPHALLFFGMEGIGKALTAKTLAMALLCDAENRPCGKCPSCQSFVKGIHPDFFLLEPEGKTVKMIKIEQIRQMQADISRSPYLADKLVVVIDGADKINETAANALLKTLEEPVGNIFFILAANNKEKVLATILSRCVNIYFSLLDNESVNNILQKKEIAVHDAAKLADLSGGSIKQALTLYENNGLENRDMAFKFLTDVFIYSDENIWQTTENLLKFKREQLNEWIFYLQMFWRDMIILYHEDDIKLYNSDMKKELLEQKYIWNLQQIFLAVEYSQIAEQRLMSNADMRLIIESFILKLRNLK